MHVRLISRYCPPHTRSEPHHAHAIDLVNAGIEIRLFGSLVANKE